MEALVREKQRFALETGSLAYHPQKKDGAADESEDDAAWEDGNQGGTRSVIKTKNEKHTELVASVMATYLSPSFETNFSALRGSEIDAQLKESLQAASLGADNDPAVQKEVLQYLKQVLLSLHGIHIPDPSATPSEANSDACQQQQLQATAAASRAHSCAAGSMPDSRPCTPSNQPAPSPSPPPLQPPVQATSSGLPLPTQGEHNHMSDENTALHMASQAATAAQAAVALPEQQRLLQGQPDQLAAIISAAASAATTAAAAAVAGMWQSSNGGKPWNSYPGPQYSNSSDTHLQDQNVTTAGVLHRQTGSGGRQASGDSPEPQPQELDRRVWAAVGAGQRQGSHPAPHPTRTHVRVIKLGQPRVTARAAPAPGGDSPLNPAFHTFRDAPFSPGGNPQPLPLPVINPLPSPATHPAPPVTTTNYLPPQQYVETGISLARGTHGSPGRHGPEQQIGSPRPAFRPPGVQHPGGEGPGSPVPGNTLQPGRAVRSPVAAARQQQAQTAAATRWDPAQGTFYAETGVMPPSSPNRRPPTHTQQQQLQQQQQQPHQLQQQQPHQLQRQYDQPHQQQRQDHQQEQQHQQLQHQGLHNLITAEYGPRSDATTSIPAVNARHPQPSTPVRLSAHRSIGQPAAHVPTQPIVRPASPPIQAAQPGSAPYQARPPPPPVQQQPQWQPQPVAVPAAPPRQPQPLPQDLQGTIQRTLAYLADPTAPPPARQAPAPAPWPPPQKMLQNATRQAAERELTAQLGGPLDYARLVQELEEARHRSNLMGRQPPANPAAPPAAAAAPQLAKPAAAGGNVTGGQAAAGVAERLAARGVGLSQGVAGRAGPGGGDAGRAGPSWGVGRTLGGGRLAGTGGASDEAGGAVAAGLGRGRAAADLLESVPPPVELWDDDTTWNDPEAFAQAVRHEITYRTTAHAARPLTQHELDAAVASRMYRLPAPRTKSPPGPANPTNAGAMPADRLGQGQAIPVGSTITRAQTGKGRVTDPARAAAVLAAATALAERERAQESPPKAKAKVQLAFGRRVISAKSVGAASAGAGDGSGSPGTAGAAAVPRRVAAARAGAAAAALLRRGTGGDFAAAIAAAVEAALAARDESRPHGHGGAATENVADATKPLLLAAAKLADAQSQHSSVEWGGDSVSRVLSALASVLADEENDLRSSLGDQMDAIHDQLTLTPGPHANRLLSSPSPHQAPLPALPPPATTPALPSAQSQDAVQPSLDTQFQQNYQQLSQYSHFDVQNTGQYHHNHHHHLSMVQTQQSRPRPRYLHVADMDARGLHAAHPPLPSLPGQNMPHALPMPREPHEQARMQHAATHGMPHIQQHPVQSASGASHDAPRAHHLSQPPPADQSSLHSQLQQSATAASQSSLHSQLQQSATAASQSSLHPHPHMHVQHAFGTHHLPTIPEQDEEPQGQPPEGHAPRHVEADEELSATVTRLPLYGDAVVLGAAGAMPLHPGAATRLQDYGTGHTQGRQGSGGLQEAVLSLLVDDVMSKVLARSAPPSVPASGAHVNPLSAHQRPPAIPLLTDAQVAYTLVNQVLQEQLEEMLAPISQDLGSAGRRELQPNTTFLQLPGQQQRPTTNLDNHSSALPSTSTPDFGSAPAQNTHTPADALASPAPATGSAHFTTPGHKPAIPHATALATMLPDLLGRGKAQTSTPLTTPPHTPGLNATPPHGSTGISIVQLSPAQRLLDEGGAEAVRAGQEAAEAALAAIAATDRATVAATNHMPFQTATRTGQGEAPAPASAIANAGTSQAHAPAGTDNSTAAVTTGPNHPQGMAQGTSMPQGTMQHTVPSTVFTLQVPVPIPMPYPFPALYPQAAVRYPNMWPMAALPAHHFGKLATLDHLGQQPSYLGQQPAYLGQPAHRQGQEAFTASPSFARQQRTAGRAGAGQPVGRSQATSSRYALPGLDRLLLDSDELGSSSDSEMAASALRQALRAQGSALATALGTGNGSGHVGVRDVEQLLARSYPEATLDALSAPVPRPVPALTGSQQEPTLYAEGQQHQSTTAPQHQLQQQQQSTEEPGAVTPVNYQSPRLPRPPKLQQQQQQSSPQSAGAAQSQSSASSSSSTSPGRLLRPPKLQQQQQQQSVSPAPVAADEATAAVLKPGGAAAAGVLGLGIGTAAVSERSVTASIYSEDSAWEQGHLAVVIEEEEEEEQEEDGPLEVLHVVKGTSRAEEGLAVHEGGSGQAIEAKPSGQRRGEEQWSGDGKGEVPAGGMPEQGQEETQGSGASAASGKSSEGSQAQLAGLVVDGGAVSEPSHVTAQHVDRMESRRTLDGEVAGEVEDGEELGDGAIEPVVRVTSPVGMQQSLPGTAGRNRRYASDDGDDGCAPEQRQAAGPLPVALTSEMRGGSGSGDALQAPESGSTSAAFPLEGTRGSRVQGTERAHEQVVRLEAQSEADFQDSDQQKLPVQQQHSQQQQQQQHSKQQQRQGFMEQLSVNDAATGIGAPLDIHQQWASLGSIAQHTAQQLSAGGVAVHVHSERPVTESTSTAFINNTEVDLASTAEMESRLAASGLHSASQPSPQPMPSLTPPRAAGAARAGAAGMAKEPGQAPSLSQYQGPTRRLWRAHDAQPGGARGPADISLDDGGSSLWASDEAGSTTSADSSLMRAGQRGDALPGAAGAGGAGGSRAGRIHGPSSSRMRGFARRRRQLLNELGITEDGLLLSQTITSASSDDGDDN